MRLLALLSLLLLQAADENPLVPKYPFKSCRITFKKAVINGVGVSMQVQVKGAKTSVHNTYSRPDKPVEELIDIFDGATCFSVAKEGSEVIAVAKSRPIGAIVGELLAKLPAESKAAFRANLEAVWDHCSPVHANSIGTKPLVYKAPAKIAGKECVVYELGKETYWRWKGTDLYLKVEAEGGVIEAEKIEEDVEIADAVFQSPKPGIPNDEPSTLDQARWIVGRYARNANDGKFAAEIDGRKVAVAALTCDFSVEERGNFLAVDSEPGEWRFGLSMPVEVKSLKELDGKTLKFKYAEGVSEASFTDGKFIEYAAKELSVKVRASGNFLDLSISGTWEKWDESGEKRKVSVVTVPDFTLKIPVAP